jgi:Cu(I)/Ag(I) efflux system membrane fusion protein
MSGTNMTRARLATAAGALALLAGGIGFGIARLGNTASSPAQQAQPDQRNGDEDDPPIRR